MEQINLTIEDLKVRDKIIKMLSHVDLLSYDPTITGKLLIKSDSLGHKGSMHDFDRILSSIYQYKKTKDLWQFIQGNIEVNFGLTKNNQ